MVYSASTEGSAGYDAYNARFANMDKIGDAAEWLWGHINKR